MDKNENSLRSGISSESADIVMNFSTMSDVFSKNPWIGDSTASCQHCNSDEGLYEYVTISQLVLVGEGTW